MEIGNHTVILGKNTIKFKQIFKFLNFQYFSLVDWSSITALPWYSNTVQAVPRVARYIARFIKFLIKFGVPIENLHIVGFSLGVKIQSINT